MTGLLRVEYRTGTRYSRMTKPEVWSSPWTRMKSMADTSRTNKPATQQPTNKRTCVKHREHKRGERKSRESQRTRVTQARHSGRASAYRVTAAV